MNFTHMSSIGGHAGLAFENTLNYYRERIFIVNERF